MKRDLSRQSRVGKWVEIIFPHRIDRIMALLIGLFLVWYTLPLWNYREQIAGYPADILALAGQLPWFCTEFIRGNIWIDNHYYPDGINGAVNYDSPLLQLLACPLLNWGPVAGVNFLLGLQLFLIVGVSYALAKYFIQNAYLRWVLVILYSFSTIVLTRKDIHLNILSTAWATPLIFLYFWRLSLSRAKEVVIGFGLLALTFLSAWQNIAHLTLLAGLLLFRAWKEEKIPLRVAIKHTGVGVLVCVGLCLPLVWPAFRERQEGVFFAEQSEKMRADVGSYFWPLPEQWWRKLVPLEMTYTQDFEQYVGLDPLVLLLLVGIVVAFLMTKARQVDWWWVALSGMFGLLSFGHRISVFGTTLLPLPYYPLLSSLPPFLFTRAPARYAVVAGFLLMLMAVWWLDRKVLPKIGRSTMGVWIPLILLIYAAWSVTLGQANVQQRVFGYRAQLPLDAFEQMATDPNKSPVLDLPITLEVDPMPNFVQLYHDQPLLFGYTSYRVLTPSVVQRAFKQDQLLYLTCLTQTAEGLNKPDQDTEILRAQLKASGVKYVVTNLFLLNQTECDEARAVTQALFDEITEEKLLEHRGSHVVFWIDDWD